MIQIPACYRNKLELWKDGKQNAHLPGDTQTVEGMAMAASVAQRKHVNAVWERLLSLGNRKPRFSDSLCSPETTDPITRCMCVSHVL